MSIIPAKAPDGLGANNTAHAYAPLNKEGDKSGFNASGSQVSVDLPMTDAELQAAIQQGVQSFCTRFYQSNKERTGEAMKPVVDKAPDDDD